VPVTNCWRTLYETDTDHRCDGAISRLGKTTEIIASVVMKVDDAVMVTDGRAFSIRGRGLQSFGI